MWSYARNELTKTSSGVRELYNQEVPHQINIALQKFITESEQNIQRAFGIFSATQQSNRIIDIYTQFGKYADGLFDYKMIYTTPEPINQSEPDVAIIKKRLITEEERAEKGMAGARERVIPDLRKSYRDEMDGDYLSREINERIGISHLLAQPEYWIDEVIEPTQIINTRERPETYNVIDQLIEALEYKVIPVSHGTITNIEVPDIDNEYSLIPERIYFTDKNGVRHLAPDNLSQQRMTIIEGRLQAHRNKAKSYQVKLVNAISVRIKEYNAMKETQTNLGTWQPGSISLAQKTFLVDLISDNKRLSKPEKITLVEVCFPVMTKGLASDIIKGLERENNERREKNRDKW